MCGSDDHLAWKHSVSLEACKGLRTTRGSIFVPNLDWPSWTRVKGRLTKASDQPDQRVDKRNMDSQVVTVDQFHGHGFVSGGYSWPRPENKWVEGLALG
ncbi:hypothetical protein CK203_038189 [Vitis vinifera]|uniref:Uncharacterized protein n=1 Tax=Vitis vinifera TaxID=29760 RepID=A0A438IBS4_VITVI|nr:hypothetical protein CK203_038189 [Vitis vinifera]